MSDPVPSPPHPQPGRIACLQAAGIELCFAEMKDPVKDKLKRFGLFSRLGEETFFPTVGAAVSTYLETHAVDWVDWEKRSP